VIGAGQGGRPSATISRAVAVAALAFAIAACGPTPAAVSSAASGVADPASPRLTAKDLAFDRTTVEVPAGRPFTLVFDNEDGAPHNVAIYRDDAATNRLFSGEIFGGPATRAYAVPALAAGTYTFRCDVHQDMHGTVIAAAGSGVSPSSSGPGPSS
jgi:plastocyanin